MVASGRTQAGRASHLTRHHDGVALGPRTLRWSRLWARRERDPREDDFWAAARSNQHERNHLSYVYFPRRLCRRTGPEPRAPSWPSRYGAAPLAYRRAAARRRRARTRPAVAPARCLRDGTQYVRANSRSVAGGLAGLVGRRAAVSRS